MATALSGGARLDWGGSVSFDVIGYDVYVSLYSGGPYQKVNSQPIQNPLRTFTATGLIPLQTYYVVMKAVDLAGNQSAYSQQVSVMPQP